MGMQQDGRGLGRWEFTSESVTEGHPDKICDQIADAVLDATLAQDENARVACEVATTTGMVLIMGEVSASAKVDVAKIARRTIKEIGYTRAEYGLDADTCNVLVALDEQSPDISQGVDAALEVREAASQGDAAGTLAGTAGRGDARPVDRYDSLGAGDQGLMFGYACDETEEGMPRAVMFAHRLAQRLAEVRRTGIVPHLRPDGKTQVTVAYQDGEPARVTRVVVSAQHDPELALPELREAIEKHVIRHVIEPQHLDPGVKFYINPTGRFVVGGPQGDSGMTGRKIIVDTYGGAARHGGGSFSGKDPTKVDRSGAYAARYLAKNVVQAGLARRCEVQVAYVIGVARPVSFMVDTFGTGEVPDAVLAGIVTQHFDLRPAAIIERFGLRRPIYRRLACYGHFGRPELNLPWEQTDLAPVLREAAGEWKAGHPFRVTQATAAASAEARH